MTLWRGKDPLILASQSRARQMLLANAGIHFEAVPADIDARAVQQSSGLSAPGEIAALLARVKALDVSMRQPEKYVSAPIRPWRWSPGCSASRPAVPRPASSYAISLAELMNCTPPLRWRATARYCSKTPVSRA